MEKERNDIPLWTWFNGQFLFQFEEQLEKNPNKTIAEFFKDFLVDQKLNNFNFYHTKNQGTIIFLMYGLMVIPKEIWEKSKTDFPFSTRQKFKFNPLSDQSIDTLNFLRLLRNSLAHANFSLDSDEDFGLFGTLKTARLKILK
ncbi:hypothetical protein [Dyadobacter frigoris]|uniref:pEK499-p136 HEPN domain-containing protein n=1 Tax=Dyadobacter frigoris TaxID=2576211 RepID=A0A4U6CPY3_9BACT|nr:hypothetical protein [Dyadobacter frigoris]TKT86539.1 hypothetical protein FDK13_32180 [Dyadobacter frigoris]